MLPVQAQTPQSGAERPQRANVTLLCEVRQGTKPWVLVRIEEISQRGFRIPWLPNCAADFPIRIRIPGLQVLTAKVRWQNGRSFGCEFDQPLHIAVYERVVAESDLERRIAG